MIGFATGLHFLSSGGVAVSGGSVTVPDEPYVEPEPIVPDPVVPDPVVPIDPDPVDPGTGETGTGETGGGTSTPAPDPVTPPPTLPVTATARWHPAHSSVTLDGNRVTSASDAQGLASVTAPIGEGPTAHVDALGQPFWRFEGDSYLAIADALTLSTRAMSVFLVGRFHQVAIRSPVFSLGTVASGSPPNTIRPGLETAIEGNGIAALRTYSYPRNSSYPDLGKMVTGAQMQVVGMVGRANVEGGSRLWMNTDRITVQEPYSVSNIAGAEIGRYAHQPGNSGSWGRFDLYEMIVMDSAVSDTDGDQLVSDLMTTYGIVPAVNQLVLEGDSIMSGAATIGSGSCSDMVLAAPGAGLLGPDWRVLNMASNGATISKLIQRRDADHGWITKPLSGQNVMAFELGRNDMSAGGQSPTTHYANVVGYLTDDVGTTGQSILAHGWDVRTLVNIASAASLEAVILGYRALLRDPAFAIDTQTGTGGAFAGQMQLIDTDLITSGGDPIFATSNDAADVTYYAGDNTHPSVAGCALRATGGDNPAHGISYGL